MSITCRGKKGTATHLTRDINGLPPWRERAKKISVEREDTRSRDGVICCLSDEISCVGSVVGI